MRGFDGESSLLAERGWYGRNEIRIPLDTTTEAFVALDSGRVSGPSARHLVGQSLTGTALGLRGAWRNLSYELLLATPVKQPEHFRTAKLNLAFNMMCSF